MNLKDKYGKVALVAGASEGLGAAYANALAKQGMDLVMIARRKEQLEATCKRIVDEFRVNVTPVACDLSDANALSIIQEHIKGADISFMVYNAALPYIGPFLNLPAAEHEKIATVNMVTPMKMVHYFGNKMMAKGKGGIILMTSLAGLQGSGFLATYASTKAFNLVLAESLWYEWKNKGVDIIGCCAGATATPNFINSKPGKTGSIEPQVQKPEEVVAECFKKIGQVPSFISGGGNRLASYFMRHFVSRKRAINIISDATRKMYGVEY